MGLQDNLLNSLHGSMAMKGLNMPKEEGYVPRIMSTTHVQKLWGYETIIVNSERYCGKILTVIPNGMACSIHYHKLKTETFHVLRGELCLDIYDLRGRDGVDPDMINCQSCLWHRLKQGDSVTLEPFMAHRFWVENEVAEFIEFSTPDDPEDSYRLKPSGPRPGV